MFDKTKQTSYGHAMFSFVFKCLSLRPLPTGLLFVATIYTQLELVRYFLMKYSTLEVDKHKIISPIFFVFQTLLKYDAEKIIRVLLSLLLGMEEVRLHSFLRCCGSATLNSIFPISEKQRITFEEMKEITVFEETEGHEQTITYWHNYLLLLSNYEPGTFDTVSVYAYLFDRLVLYKNEYEYRFLGEKLRKKSRSRF